MTAQTPTTTAAERKTLPTRCDRCNAPLRSPAVCEHCHALLNTGPLNYFDLLGLPRRYDLDAKQLRDAFRSIAQNVHPDRFAGHPDNTARATRLSAEVNQAIAVLSDPVRRASYLLEMFAGPTSGELRDVPQQVLAEVMMFREELEQARATDDRAAIESHRQTIAERKRAVLQEIEHRANAIATGGPDEKKDLRRLLNAVKYFDNLSSELAEDPLA